MAGKERIRRLGGSDPRTGAERLAGVINRGAQPKPVREQHRTYEDSPSRMKRNKDAAAAELAKRGVRSSSPKRR